MRKSFVRAAIAAAGLLSAASFGAAAQASDFSIDTTVAGGSAWVINNNYITGTVHLGSPSPHVVTAYIGAINLHGTMMTDPGHATGDLKVFCIDIPDNLGNGKFVETTTASMYSSSQMQSLTKFLAYASTQSLTTATNSAAAQLGVWEIISESSTNWDLSSGNLTVDNMSDGGSAATVAMQWLNASKNYSSAGYTLHVLDPGRGNQVQAFVTGSPAVPEPATWGMMVMGFGVLGAALRRRKEQGVFA